MTAYSPDLVLRIRQAAGLSQLELAQRLGVDKMTINRWETGRRQPRDTAALLAELVDILRQRRDAASALLAELEAAHPAD